MSVCLVTGAAGFLGSHMADLLAEQGFDVIGVDNLQAGDLRNISPHPRMRFVRGDIRERAWWSELPDRLSHIFHFAANASVPVSTTDPIYDTSTNVVGTAHMLELARARAARLVFASTAAVYGNPVELPTRESHPTQPISVYGVSKLAGEGLIRFYQETHGLDAQIIRFFNCFGPRQPRYIVFDYLTKAEETEGPFLVLGNGEQRRTQLYVADAVAATLLVAQKGDGRPYNVGSDRVFTALEIAETVLRITNQPHREIRCTGVSWPGDIAVLQPALDRLRELGFTPRVSLEEGLARTCEWWQSRRVSA